MKFTARFDKHYFIASTTAWLASRLVHTAIMLAFGYRPRNPWERVSIDPQTERTADEKRWGR